MRSSALNVASTWSSCTTQSARSSRFGLSSAATVSSRLRSRVIGPRKIVRDAVPDVPHAFEQVLDLVEHRIDVLRELVVLVVAAFERRAPA